MNKKENITAQIQPHSSKDSCGGSILVIRLSALGDVAMTIPSIYSVARTYPQQNFKVVTSAFCARLFIGKPENVEVIGLTKEESKGVAGTWRLLRRLTGMDVRAVADLHNVLRSWVLDMTFRLRGRKVVMMNKMRGERRDILAHRCSTSRPVVMRYFDVFARLGLPARQQFESLFAVQPPLPAIAPPKQGRWVGIAPFARYRNKMCATENLRDYARRIAHEGADVFLFGARGKEAELLSGWADGCSHIHVVAGALQIEEELALMSYLDVMLTMDSANMHLASLVGTRVISFWGSTTPACGFLGWNQKEEDAVCLGLDCQPCTIAGSEYCRLKTFACLKAECPEIKF
ncbi:MAG: glycosyltransferase family 9 protein [Bacteroidaceae bacterium]|nr:glycosyltransferase family 9 protein [Bacteroidaceae bacterium]